jgi:hypothetical protein
MGDLKMSADREQLERLLDEGAIHLHRGELLDWIPPARNGTALKRCHRPDREASFVV